MIICLRSQNHQDLLPGNHFFSPCRIFTNILETSQAFIGRFFIQTWRARVWDRYHSLGQKEKQEMISFVLKSETKCRVFESFQPKWIFVSVHLATVGAFWPGWGSGVRGGPCFQTPSFLFLSCWFRIRLGGRKPRFQPRLLSGSWNLVGEGGAPVPSELRLACPVLHRHAASLSSGVQ